MHKVLWGGHSQDSWSELATGHHAQEQKPGERRHENAPGSDGVYIPKKLLHMRSPAFLELAEYRHADWKY